MGFSEALGLPVATSFNGKGVFPDDHPHSLGAVGFMRHDYVNFGFDEADVIVSVGYELQEFDPVRINPGGDKRIIHLSRVPAEVDVHYDVEVGVQADICQDARCARRRHDAKVRARRERREDPAPTRTGAGARCERRQLSCQATAHRRRHP